VENEASVESRSVPGLGRMDSETIPRSIRGPYAAGDASKKEKKERKEKKEKKERRERSTSPEPNVQRSFSFPDDIADEEVFNTRETTTEATGTRADDKREAEPTANEPVRLPALSNFSEFMRSHSSLPPVQEELSDEEMAEGESQPSATRHTPGTRRIPETPELHRDSGFSSGSPHLSRSLPIPDDHEKLRDSGVHLRDSGESTTPVRESHHRSLSPRIPDERLGVHTPRNEDAERRFRRSPLSGHRGASAVGPETPRLDEPSPPPRTPEPEKLHVNKKRAPASNAAITPQVSAGGGGVPVGRPIETNPNPTASRMSPNTSLARLRTPELPAALRPDSPGSLRSVSGGTPPLQLRRMDKRTSGNLRSASLGQLGLPAKSREQKQPGQQPATPNQNSAGAARAISAAALAAGVSATAAPGTLQLQSSPLPATTTTSTSSQAAANTTPVANEGRVRAKDMADVFDGYGEGRIGSPRSPTRPHSMRRRQSMQVLELESRVEQLLAENRMLADARTQSDSSYTHHNATALAERESEIESLRRMLREANEVINRLKQTNEGLRSSTSAIAVKHTEELRHIETQNGQVARELDLARGAVAQHARAVKDKDVEIAQLRAELEASADQIRDLQKQILEQSRPSDDPDFLVKRDIDYFDHRCQQLCAHVQQWVLRFSKFSDMRACRLTSEFSDEKLIDRLDNAVLDGTNVDTYLNDRVRRRDIFMSMTMTMIWEFVFTRYLFGMDREQRQKLKQLEKQLIDVGPPHAVRQWRAVTLTLLSRRPSFKKQRDLDTEAVVQAILDTLSKILPPPSNLEDQIQSQLRRVVREAVLLAIEMRCQRAEYMMLPPLQPEYDDTGELTETVNFNAALMNEASGNAEQTNEELEAANSTVRVVLFPLVLRKGDEIGKGEDEIVVTPAQVLVGGISSNSRRGSPAKGLGRMLTPVLQETARPGH
jgi:hypothetical protein